MEILINVIYQKLRIATNMRDLVEGTKKFIKFIFTLDNHWQDMKIFAQFTQNDKSYNVYLDSENSVYLPQAIKQGICTVMLYGIKNDGTVIATTASLQLKINKSGYIEDTSSTDIPPSIYQQLIAKIDKIEDTFLTIDDELNTNSVHAIQNKIVSNALNTKVDKVNGKGLSTNDYTTAEKNKLSDIESGANKTVVDSELSATSENPLQNKAIKAELDKKADKTDDTGTGNVTVDSALSDTSINPVQNKTIKAELDKKANLSTNSGGFIGGSDASMGSYVPTDNEDSYYATGAAIGKEAYAVSGIAAGFQATSYLGGAALGYQAYTDGNGGAVGCNARATNGFAGGANAWCGALDEEGNLLYYDNIQLGEGTNGHAKTLQVYNYQLMDANGKIPLDRLPDSVKNGAGVTVDSELSNTSENPVQNKVVKTELDKKANESNSSNGFHGGTVASAKEGGAIGYSAKANKGGAVGYGAEAGDGFSGGLNASVAYTGQGLNKEFIDAIQLGTGVNSNPKTLQAYEYQLMDAEGNVPLDRLQAVTDGFVSKTTTGTNKILIIDDESMDGISAASRYADVKLINENTLIEKTDLDGYSFQCSGTDVYLSPYSVGTSLIKVAVEGNKTVVIVFPDTVDTSSQSNDEFWIPGGIVCTDSDTFIGSEGSDFLVLQNGLVFCGWDSQNITKAKIGTNNYAVIELPANANYLYFYSKYTSSSQTFDCSSTAYVYYGNSFSSPKKYITKIGNWTIKDESVQIDSELSATSENAVQNRAVYQAINEISSQINTTGSGLTLLAKGSFNSSGGFYDITAVDLSRYSLIFIEVESDTIITCPLITESVHILHGAQYCVNEDNGTLTVGYLLVKLELNSDSIVVYTAKKYSMDGSALGDVNITAIYGI